MKRNGRANPCFSWVKCLSRVFFSFRSISGRVDTRWTQAEIGDGATARKTHGKGPCAVHRDACPDAASWHAHRSWPAWLTAEGPGEGRRRRIAELASPVQVQRRG